MVLIFGRHARPNGAVVRHAKCAAIGGPRIEHEGAKAAPRECVPVARQVIRIKLVAAHRHRVQRLPVGGDLPVDRMAFGIGQ